MSALACLLLIGQGQVDYGMRLALGVLKHDPAHADAYKMR